MAYVLGFFAADGSMVKNSRGACFIEFHVTDIEILEKIRVAMESDHKISVRLPRHKKWKTSYRLQIGSKDMFNDLQSLGFSQTKTKIIRVPQVPYNYFWDFVRGYFDGDGCITSGTYKVKDRKNPRFTYKTSFTSGSLGFLEDLKKIFKERGIASFIYTKKQNKKEIGYDLVLSHRSSLALYGYMYNNRCHSIYLERKKKIFDRIIKMQR
tara:strand:+ start:217 stop:846 length:630 start_codon:yes stop_codon:yes gene_type:complete